MYYGYTTNDASGIAFWIGNFPIRYYGIFFAVGLFAAVLIGILKLHFFYKVRYEPFFYFVFIAVVTILLGARLWSYIIGDSTDWSKFFAFRDGGLAVEGGVIFTAIAAVVWFSLITRSSKYFIRVEDEFGVASVRRASMWIYADSIIPLILFGQAIGRWGNFFNHEVFGAAVGTDVGTQSVQLYGGTTLSAECYDPGNAYLWLKNVMPGVYKMMFIYADGVFAFRVPLFLIESFFNILAFAFIYGIADQIKGYRNGINAGLYFVYYGAIRAYLETLRDRQYRFDTSIVTSILFAVFGLCVVIFATVIAPKLRRKRMWFIIYSYIIFGLKYIGYMFVFENKHKKESSDQNSKWKKTKSLVAKKGNFLDRKANLGYEVHPKFTRTDVEMLYYYELDIHMGPMFQFIASTFKQIFKKNTKENNV